MLKKVVSGAAIAAIAVGGLLATGGQAFADTVVADGATESTGVWTWQEFPQPDEVPSFGSDWILPVLS